MKAIVWFLVISFLPAWISWEIAIAAGLDVLSWQMQLFLVPGAFCPALATVVLILGMFTLAVPGSTNFAGEFAILAGVFERGWGYAAVGAAAIVLAAMYALRLISAILHDRRERGAESSSGDLVGGELALVLPLVAILAVLSAYPALVSDRSFPLDQPSTFISSASGVSG